MIIFTGLELVLFFFPFFVACGWLANAVNRRKHSHYKPHKLPQQPRPYCPIFPFSLNSF